MMLALSSCLLSCRCNEAAARSPAMRQILITCGPWSADWESHKVLIQIVKTKARAKAEAIVISHSQAIFTACHSVLIDNFRPYWLQEVPLSLAIGARE
jgi:hypothetical protein